MIVKTDDRTILLKLFYHRVHRGKHAGMPKITECVLFDADTGKELSRGRAKYNFDEEINPLLKKTGRSIAINRAFSSILSYRQAMSTTLEIDKAMLQGERRITLV